MCLPYLFTAPCPIQPPELPEGWLSIQHASGATVYFHRESRVCSWSMPYTIKKGTTVKVRCIQTSVYCDNIGDEQICSVKLLYLISYMFGDQRMLKGKFHPLSGLLNCKFSL